MGGILLQKAVPNESWWCDMSAQMVSSQRPSLPAEEFLTVVDGNRSWNRKEILELWRYRELFYYLTLRDIRLRYKQTILGVGWSVFQPLATVLVFSIFIGVLGKAAEGIEYYTLFVLSGVLPWNFFCNATLNAANSLVGNERLVTKIYFPRILLPASNVGAAFFDFLVSCCVLAAWILLAGPPSNPEGMSPALRLFLGGVTITTVILGSVGIGSGLAALIAVQRDFRYLLSFGMQLWMFATPSIYLAVEGRSLGWGMTLILRLNPIQGIVRNFRAAVLDYPPDWTSLVFSLFAAGIFFVLGTSYFRRAESTIADAI